MAERYLIASGPVSDPANWFGGNKPTVGDVAHANGFVGQVDENITADTWTSAAGATAVAGGNFNLLDGFTITGDIAAGSGVAATAGAVTYGGVGAATIDGSVLAGQTAAQHGVSFHTNFGAATGYLTITGDVQGGAGSASRGVRWTPGNGATLDIHGRVLGGEGPSTNSHGIIIDTGTSKTLIVRNNVESRASDGININGQCTLWTILGTVVSGGDGTRFGIGVIQSGWSKAGMVGNIYGSLIGGQIADAGGIALTCNAEDEITINVHGSSVANAARACRIYGNSNATINVFGGANGGYRSGANAIAVESGAAIIDVRGASVGGSHPDAHGILNQSTSTIRVGGQSITNPSGALGVNNPGNGQVVIGYADFFSPVLRFVTEGVTPKLVIGSWAKNATHITVANPTIDVKDASFNSVIGGPQAMTVDGTDPRLMKYEHGSNIFARGNPYFLIFGGEHEGQPIPETIHPIRF